MKKKHYKTSNFYLSAYLSCKGLELIDVDKSNPRKAVFVFIDSSERESLVRLFDFGEAPVNARKYSLTLKELKNKLYS